jgi:hypothetical protein
MSVEENTAACISRGLPTVFLVIDNASRENLGGDYIFTEVVLFLK